MTSYLHGPLIPLAKQNPTVLMGAKLCCKKMLFLFEIKQQENSLNSKKFSLLTDWGQFPMAKERPQMFGIKWTHICPRIVVFQSSLLGCTCVSVFTSGLQHTDKKHTIDDHGECCSLAYIMSQCCEKSHLSRSVTGFEACVAKLGAENMRRGGPWNQRQRKGFICNGKHQRLILTQTLY